MLRAMNWGWGKMPSVTSRGQKRGQGRKLPARCSRIGIVDAFRGRKVALWTLMGAGGSTEEGMIFLGGARVGNIISS